MKNYKKYGMDIVKKQNKVSLIDVMFLIIATGALALFISYLLR